MRGFDKRRNEFEDDFRRAERNAKRMAVILIPLYLAGALLILGILAVGLYVLARYAGLIGLPHAPRGATGRNRNGLTDSRYPGMASAFTARTRLRPWRHGGVRGITRGYCPGTTRFVTDRFAPDSRRHAADQPRRFARDAAG